MRSFAMEKIFDDFRILCKKSLELDPCVELKGLKGYVKEMKDETEELVTAIENNDIENIKEELGDVLLDWIHTVLIAEKEHGFTMEQIIGEVKDKLDRRKPYLGENRKVTAEEARNLWQDEKLNERTNQ